ncbi:Tfpi protein [Danaus plexippus plexippus]|uniref:Tfpi protein n=1 Tax=Danaus plexippus plexippus TaxID=278856 RepID=A0A212F986_DANPL|nr:Tfpi protein [Danaus plexippus plexippus]
MYYFEPTTKNCSTFSWGGCQGNGNRFDSRSECTSTCLSSPNQQKTRPKWCTLNFDYGFCFGALKRWYYDPMWKVCKERIYSGCGGNKNNFYSQEQCDAICRFGVGPLTGVHKTKDNIKKILIINPWNATSKRSKIQTIPSSAAPTI